MGTFFKPVRRKLGAVTLVLACLLAVGWMRSFVVGDEFQVAVVFGRDNQIKSERGELIWKSWPNNLPPWDSRWHTWPIRQSIDGPRLEPNDWPIRFVELEAFHFSPDFVYTGYGLICSYWAIVLPLTLLSAWLLFSKPRTKEPPAQNRN